MSGETELNQLIKHMRPQLHAGEYVFVTQSQPAEAVVKAAVMTFQEAEGTTLILPRADADAWGLAYDYVAAWLTLQVHSSLAAVGLTAAVSTALAAKGISCNVVAGFYHDHLFVDKTDAAVAQAVLQTLAVS
ncbi:MAG: acetyltransferase [Gammaproteobacteria bacterium]|nr:MAG: acetyltransferase [Gammaproteobacteria bacterium]